MTPESRRERGPAGRPGRWSLAVLAIGQVVLVGWAVTTGAVVLFVLVESLLVALLAVVVSYRRYRSFRRAYEHGIARRAVEQQRAELAGELHDALGHELSLIALRAGALQVSSSGPVAEAAAQVRSQVEQAVVALQQTVALLRSSDSASASLEPAPSGLVVADLVERANAAGAAVSLSGALDAAVPAPTRMTAYRVAQEGLTNALKHAPGSQVDIELRSSPPHAVEVSIAAQSNAASTVDAEPPAGSGLTGLQRRVTALGGELTVTHHGGRHLTQARLPLHPTTASPEAPIPAASAVRRPLAATARSTLVPLAAVAVVVLAFYAWAVHGATIEQPVFDGLAAGQPTSSLTALPARQAPVRLLAADPAPPQWQCRYYTDGNFPLATASFEICDDGTTLTRVSDLRRHPLR